MLAGAEPIAFVAVRDAARAMAFYSDVLGLRLLADEPFAVVYETGGVTLRLAKTAEVHPAPYTVLGWRVADVAEAVRELAGRGVVFVRFDGLEQNEAGIWTSPGGAQVAWFKDPDGNLLSLTEEAVG